MKQPEPDLQVYSEVNTNRFRYAASFLFEDVLEYRVSLVYIESDIDPNTPLISYSHRPVNENAFHIRPAHLLKEKSIEEQEINFIEWGNLKAFFPVEGVDLPFDILAAVFYLTARYEEYLPHDEDHHGRYTPEQSTAYKGGFLNEPLVDQWALKMDTLLYQRFDIKHSRKFKFINTIDVDSAYAYREKGLFRTAGASLRSLFKGDFKDLLRRLSTVAGRRKDPFNNFDDILKINEKYGFKSIFFFLLADYGLYDKNVPYTGTRFRSLIKYINDYSKVGIHPSYASSDDADLLAEEIRRLNKTVHMPVKHSRHHFLKVRLPDTYRDLLECEIRHDYTMGYASEPGFRASTSTPFLFFDIPRNRITRLRVHPFCVMEACLRDYKNLSARKSAEIIKTYIDKVAQVRGTLYMLWHNDSLTTYDSNGWRQTYEESLAYIKSKIDEQDSE